MSYELLLPACFALAIGLRNYDFGPVLPACFALAAVVCPWRLGDIINTAPASGL